MSILQLLCSGDLKVTQLPFEPIPRILMPFMHLNSLTIDSGIDQPPSSTRQSTVELIRLVLRNDTVLMQCDCVW
jgi:hypothetical protein